MKVDQVRHELYQDKASGLIGQFLCELVLSENWQDDLLDFLSLPIKSNESDKLATMIMAMSRKEQRTFIKKQFGVVMNAYFFLGFKKGLNDKGNRNLQRLSSEILYLVDESLINESRYIKSRINHHSSSHMLEQGDLLSEVYIRLRSAFFNYDKNIAEVGTYWCWVIKKLILSLLASPKFVPVDDYSDIHEYSIDACDEKPVEAFVEDSILLDAVHNLSKKHADLISMRFGLGQYNPMTFQEMADLSGLSAIHVRQNLFPAAMNELKSVVEY